MYARRLMKVDQMVIADLHIRQEAQITRVMRIETIRHRDEKILLLELILEDVKKPIRRQKDVLHSVAVNVGHPRPASVGERRFLILDEQRIKRKPWIHELERSITDAARSLPNRPLRNAAGR